MKPLSELKLKWQLHNRDNGLSWNEVAELVNEVEGLCRDQPEQKKLLNKFLKYLDEHDKAIWITHDGIIQQFLAANR
jgi:hypothetical protein